MYTHCPHCDTYFRVTSDQLKRADGDVRCGRCFGTFNALKHLVDEPPVKTSKPALPTLKTAQVVKGRHPSVTAKETPAGDNINEIETETSAEALSTLEKKDIKRDHSQQLIEELQQGGTRSSGAGRSVLWGIASIPLALLLATQYAYFNLDQLSQNPQYRPALEALCSIANCEVPLMKAPQLMRLTERDIRADVKNKDILVVKAVIHNEADFTQAFPIMQLSMQDITGHVMTGRRFLPEEYLADPGVNIRAGIGAKKSYKIQLEMVDPGKEAVGFEFEFL